MNISSFYKSLHPKDRTLFDCILQGLFSENNEAKIQYLQKQIADLKIKIETKQGFREDLTEFQNDIDAIIYLLEETKGLDVQLSLLLSVLRAKSAYLQDQASRVVPKEEMKYKSQLTQDLKMCIAYRELANTLLSEIKK